MKSWKTLPEDQAIKNNKTLIAKKDASSEDVVDSPAKKGLAIVMTIIGIILIIIGIYPFFEDSFNNEFKASLFEQPSNETILTNELTAAVPTLENATGTTNFSPEAVEFDLAKDMDELENGLELKNDTAEILKNDVETSDATLNALENPELETLELESPTTTTTAPVPVISSENLSSNFEPTNNSEELLNLDSNVTLPTTNEELTTIPSTDLITPTIHTSAPEQTSSTFRINTHTGTTDKDFSQYIQEQPTVNAQQISQAITTYQPKTNYQPVSSTHPAANTAESGPTMWIFGIISLLITYFLRRKSLVQV